MGQALYTYKLPVAPGFLSTVQERQIWRGMATGLQICGPTRRASLLVPSVEGQAGKVVRSPYLRRTTCDGELAAEVAQVHIAVGVKILIGTRPKRSVRAGALEAVSQTNSQPGAG